MLKVILSIVFITINAISSYAKIWRVNNNAGVAADFITLQSAHNGATSGDTLYLEGSPTSYGALSCSKKLTIIGPGYFLDENPATQAFAQPANVGNISLNTGSDGTVIMGLNFSGNDLAIYASDIIVSRNKFSLYSGTVPDYNAGFITLGNLVRNITITQNYGVVISINYASSNILINNNYIGRGASNGDQTSSSSLDMNPGAVALVKNNIFRRGKVTL